MTTLLRFIFEKIPVLRLLNGRKTQLGRIITVASGAALLVQQEFPATPYLDTANALLGVVTGLIIKEVGEAHAEAKDR